MNGTRIGTDFKLGSTITYQCDSGYKIIEPSTITCVIGTDGKPAWNRALPSCNGMYCLLTISFVHPVNSISQSLEAISTHISCVKKLHKK